MNDKTIIRTDEGTYKVFSQPGDATRYDYIVYRDGDDFRFMGRESDFRFPPVINWWRIKDIDTSNVREVGEVVELANGICNPFTYMECVRTMKEIVEGRI